MLGLGTLGRHGVNKKMETPDWTHFRCSDGTSPNGPCCMLERAFTREELSDNYIWTLGYLGEWSEDPRTAEISAQVKSYSREWLVERAGSLANKRQLLRDQQLELKRLQSIRTEKREGLTKEKYGDMTQRRTVAASPLQMAKSLAKSAVDLTTGGVTDPKARMETCKKCPFFGSDQRCGRCGCFVPAKARVKKSTCPIGGW